MGLKNEVTNKQTDSKLVPPGADHSWLVLCPYMASLSKLLLESAVLVVEWMKKLEKNKTIKIVTFERHPLIDYCLIYFPSRQTALASF